MEKPTGPFAIPQIVVPKLTPEKFLDHLRERINKGYMPSSGKEGHNSKPEYCRHVSEWASLESGYFPGTGIYAEIDCLGSTIKNKPLWCFIDGATVELACNLGTDEIFVREPNDPHGPWFVFDKPVTVNMEVFIDKLDWL